MDGRRNCVAAPLPSSQAQVWASYSFRCGCSPTILSPSQPAVKWYSSFLICIRTAMCQNIIYVLLIQKHPATLQPPRSGIFFWSSLISLLAVGLLFSFSGAAGLLVADAVIYGMATVGAGLADGWASKAAIPNTHFSNESPGDNSFMASQLTPRNLPRKPFPRNSRPLWSGLTN